MFNHTYRYALKACAMIASMPPSTRVLAKDLAKESEIPPQYLSKILHKLARAGVLSSRKGIGGGFFLERDPGEIHLQEVVHPFRKKNDMMNTSCLICGDSCSRGSACPFRSYWEDAVGRYNALLENTTLADVACPGQSADKNVVKPIAAAASGTGGNHHPPADAEMNAAEGQAAV
jgi:Rrf2 family protein